MTETTDTGPARPKTPDVSGLGGGRRRDRARRLTAAAQGGPGAVPAALAGPAAQAPSGEPAADVPTSEHQVPVQQAAAPAPPAAASTSEAAPSTPPEQQPEQRKAAEPPAAQEPAAPIVQQVVAESPAAAAATDDTPASPAGQTAAPPANTLQPPGDATDGGPEQGKQQGISSTTEHAVQDAADEVTAQPPALGAGLQDAVDSTPSTELADLEQDADQEDDDERDDLDDETEEFAGGPITLQTYVPDVLATKFQNMQTTGRTAELIVLTAVRDCVERLPQLIADARGPVHESGLFAGLEVLEKKPGRQAKPKPNSSRVQYQVRPAFLPDLKKVAKKHKLKLSVLVRLALGDFFSVPVRIARTKR